MNLIWTLVTTLVLPLALLLILSNVVTNRRRRLPPGPAAVPLLGNLAWLTITDGQQFMATIRRFHKRYGPVITLRFGSELVVNISDRRFAHAVLVQSGAAVADRPFLASLDLLAHNNAFTITSSNYNAIWRLLRRNFVAKMAQPAQLQLFAPAREWALADLMDKLRCRKNGGDAILGMFYHTMMCILVSMCFGEWLHERAVRELTAALRELMMYSVTMLDVFVFVPAITTRVFVGRRRAMDALRRRLKGIYLPLINARRERRKRLNEESPTTTFSLSYVDTLLDIRLKDEGNRELTDDEIAGLCSEFISAGTDLPSSALQWTMAELVKNPAIQDKLYSDIRAITSGGKVSEENLQRLPYLKAVVLESLRRHPPAHQLIQHAAAADVELDTYVIPKGATVNFMVVDFGLDEAAWERPMDFVPERFMPGGDGEAVDITGTREIKMMPFGAGRRICPGIGVATLHLEYLVANLVAAFEWREVEGMEVDVVSEMFEFSAVMEKPLEVNLVARAERDVNDECRRMQE
uniref:Cytochrome P450 n=1 Tax=Leersia perrieri TaxID=77586 RepID=A0A0D9XHQ8_9ORYZ